MEGDLTFPVSVQICAKLLCIRKHSCEPMHRCLNPFPSVIVTERNQSPPSGSGASATATAARGDCAPATASIGAAQAEQAQTPRWSRGGGGVMHAARRRRHTWSCTYTPPL